MGHVEQPATTSVHPPGKLRPPEADAYRIHWRSPLLRQRVEDRGCHGGIAPLVRSPECQWSLIAHVGRDQDHPGVGALGQFSQACCQREIGLSHHERRVRLCDPRLLAGDVVQCRT